jgi:hypothetical protein
MKSRDGGGNIRTRATSEQGTTRNKGQLGTRDNSEDDILAETVPVPTSI